MNLLTNKEANKSGIIWIVMDKHRTTVLQMPGLNKPFSTKSRKYAEQVAKESDGVVESYRDAITYVASSPCNLPKDSKRYNADVKAAKIKLHRGRG